MHPRIIDILATAGAPNATVSATALYNEGWMLRLYLDWAYNHSRGDHLLAFLPEARWFSESLLSSPFSARRRDDPLSEGWTHADGVVGHFIIGETRKAELTLREGATQLVVVEAKMGSPLGPDTKNAPSYDQAARTVACMAHTLQRARIDPTQMKKLAFVVAAPRLQIVSGVFGPLVTKDHIQQRVQTRVESYGGVHDTWFNHWFLPTLNEITLVLRPWEDLLTGLDHSYLDFYNKCIDHSNVPSTFNEMPLAQTNES